MMTVHSALEQLFRDGASAEGEVRRAFYAIPDGRRADILERLLAASKMADCGHATACWVWTMADSGNGRGGGYPRIKLNGRTCAAHIVSYVNFHGYVPGNKQIDHKCRNRLCVRPDHLEMVSHRENQKRRAAAARLSDGKPDRASRLMPRSSRGAEGAQTRGAARREANP